MIPTKEELIEALSKLHPDDKRRIGLEAMLEQLLEMDKKDK